jgi:DNA polymerase-3 subunit delta'
MNNEAQNAFLKTLEEPPRDTVLILNTPNPASLLPTIISRCHMITLLENKCDYNFAWTVEVINALYRLQSCTSGHLAAGCEVADKLIAIAGTLSKEAEERVYPLWEKRLADAENPDIQWTAAQKRRVKERYEAAVASEYRYLRGIFLSLIHTWFAQNYQIACGADINFLSNPELYHHIDTDRLRRILDEEKALLHLKKAEALLQNLRWNVKEELAIREFCCAVTA